MALIAVAFLWLIWATARTWPFAAPAVKARVKGGAAEARGRGRDGWAGRATTASGAGRCAGGGPGPVGRGGGGAGGHRDRGGADGLGGGEPDRGPRPGPRHQQHQVLVLRAAQPVRPPGARVLVIRGLG